MHPLKKIPRSQNTVIPRAHPDPLYNLSSLNKKKIDEA